MNINVEATAAVSLSELARQIAKLDPFEVGDFFLQVVEAQDNPPLAKNYADHLMSHHSKWLNGGDKQSNNQ